MAFCSDNYDVPFSLSFDHCKGVYVTTWIPLSKHLFLKVIEVLLYSLHLAVIFLLIGIPIFVKIFKKLQEQVRITNSLLIIHKGKHNDHYLKEINNHSPTVHQLTILETQNSPPTPSSIVHQQVFPPKNSESVWSTVKEILMNYIRIFFDSKLLAAICCHLSCFCLILNALVFCVAHNEYGTSVHMNVAALLASLSFLCTGLIPLSGTFMELLLTLKHQNATISIHAL